MSGGVDSSVAAYLLKKQGHTVFGMMLKLWSEKNSSQNRCCSNQAVEDAQTTANYLGIPFYLLDYSEKFKSTIVDPFLEEYQAGRTPNPCLSCNQKIRFDDLRKQALNFGAQAFATGHYAVVEKTGEFFHLKMAKDSAKDQSYMLHRLDQEALSTSLFPLGSYTKPEVRKIAQEAGLPVAKKRESQDLCFLGDDHLKGFLKRNLPKNSSSGWMKDLKGQILGKHEGLHAFTIGQRKGLNLSLSEPHYVFSLDVEQNCVYLATKEQTGFDSLCAVDYHQIDPSPLPLPFPCSIKLRYHAKSHTGRVVKIEEKKAWVELDQKIFPITPGQGAVFYTGDQVVGGGFIRL